MPKCLLCGYQAEDGFFNATYTLCCDCEAQQLPLTTTTFAEIIDEKGIEFPIITIYHNTTDLPGQFIARLYDLMKPTDAYTCADSLENIRLSIPFRFTRMAPHPEDDPVILETWF